MLLQQIKDYKSIVNLPNVELPDFTIITGVNGAGKSHLLEGVEKGALTLEGCSKEDGIKCFTTQTLLTQFENRTASPTHPRTSRKEVLKLIKAKISESQRQLTEYFTKRQDNLPEVFGDLHWLMKVSKEIFLEQYKSPENTPPDPFSRNDKLAAWNSFQNFRSRLSDLGMDLRQQRDVQQLLEKYAFTEDKPVLSLTNEDIDSAIPFTWNPIDGVSLKFSALFQAYSTSWERNRMLRYYSEAYGENHPWLSDEEFISRYGPKPWDLANNVLEQCGAYYRFRTPNLEMGEEEGVSVVNSQSEGSNVSYDIKELSTGERVVLGIISLLYRATPSRSIGRLPKLLLLDEIDGPLHPAYTKALIAVLNETLVKQCGIKVILVTHSPSTVALAPLESIFELRKNPRALVQASRSQSINTLTAGFICVLPSSRVVITESGFDADIYAKYFRLCVAKALLKSDPPLIFLSSSRARDDGEGGRKEVEKWAAKLSGAFSALGFYGVIDRDGGNNPTDFVKVINRHSVENYLLDPLTVIALLIKDGVTGCFKSSPIKDMNFHAMLSLDGVQLQQLVDGLCSYIESKEPILGKGAQIASDYLGYSNVRIPGWAIDFHGKDLAKIFKAVINKLCSDEKRPIAFPIGDHSFSRVIEMQTVCMPELISNDFVPLFRRFQEPLT